MSSSPIVPYGYPTRPPASARIVLVGEAPGADEERLGRPFVGRSGRLLDESLQAVGIDREACLVANVFRVRPPNNKIGCFFSSRARAAREGRAIDERWGALGGSDRPLAEFSGDLDHLFDALAEYRPDVIVALGRTPMWALTGLNGILDRRGAPVPARPPLSGVRVVPTWHPSFILRGNFARIPVWREDLARARAIAEGVE